MSLVATPPLDSDAPDPAPASSDEPRARFEACTHLSEPGAGLLERVAHHLPLLADLTHADVVLFARAGSEAVVVAEAQPVPVPSLYQQPLGHRRVTRDEAPNVY